MAIDTDAILKKDYMRVFRLDEASGRVSATILEFPGCFADGSSVQDANNNLNAVAKSWLFARNHSGTIPEPFSKAEHKLMTLWQKIEQWRDTITRSESDPTPLDALIFQSLAVEALTIVGPADAPKY